VFRRERDGYKEVCSRSKFSPKLDDYHIERPKALFLKLVETSEAKVIFSACKDLGVRLITLTD
jgi:hypothetical protein